MPSQKFSVNGGSVTVPSNPLFYGQAYRMPSRTCDDYKSDVEKTCKPRVANIPAPQMQLPEKEDDSESDHSENTTTEKMAKAENLILTPYGLREITQPPINFTEWVQEQQHNMIGKARRLSDTDDSGSDLSAKLDSLSLSPSTSSVSTQSSNHLSYFSSSPSSAVTVATTDCSSTMLGVMPPLPMFANEYFKVRESKVAGLGAFATKNLQEGDLILYEACLVKSDMPSLFSKIEAMTSLEKDVFFSLARWSRKQDASDAEKVADANGFQSSTEGTYLICPIASRFNHACKGSKALNVQWTIDPDNDCVCFAVTKPVKKGDELFICYTPNAYALPVWFGFRCGCLRHADAEYPSTTSRYVAHW